MAICGHQFHSGNDECDWVSSTSVTCLIGGSTTAKNILEELFRKRYDEMRPKVNRTKRQESVATLPEKISSGHASNCRSSKDDSINSKEEKEHLVVKKIPEALIFENFDESQHLNGCPMKWLYNKKLLEKNKVYRVTRWCSKKSAKKDAANKEKKQNVRDKTPTEVKIHKINLIEKYTCKNDENNFPSLKLSPTEKSDENSNLLEAHKKKLATKLNWKLYDETKDDNDFESVSEISSMNNYLPLRPLLEIKPLLSILMAPQKSVCCVIKPNSQQNSTKEERLESASLSIKSLDLPIFIPEQKSQPRTTNTPRWGSKSTRLQKKLQVPNQTTINLGQNQNIKGKKQENDFKVRYRSSPVKKLNEKTTQAKYSRSLSSLFYELSNKTNNRNQSHEYLKEMIRDLTMKEDQFKIKRVLHLNFEQKNKIFENKSKIIKELEKKPVGNSELNLICGKVRIFEKHPSSRKLKGENSCKHHLRAYS